VRHLFVAGNIAQIVLDWSIAGTRPDGKHVHLGGSASDIVRLVVDRRWRYLIDNNQGTAVRQRDESHAPRQLPAMEPLFNLASASAAW
jgi:ketosteroid isomerase-like protein